MAFANEPQTRWPGTGDSLSASGRLTVRRRSQTSNPCARRWRSRLNDGSPQQRIPLHGIAVPCGSPQRKPLCSLPEDDLIGDATTSRAHGPTNVSRPIGLRPLREHHVTPAVSERLQSVSIPTAEEFSEQPVASSQTGLIAKEGRARDTHRRSDKKALYEWHKQWYPVAVVSDLDRSSPNRLWLLNRSLAVWHDGHEWQCEEEECCTCTADEHDSQGLSASAGHELDDVGRLPSEEPAPPRPAPKFPVQVAQELLWIWGDNGPTSSIESKVSKPETISQLENDGFIGIAPYVRDVAYGYDTLVENVLDPGHLPFAHHKLQFRREMACPIPTIFQVDKTKKDGFCVNVEAYGFNWDIAFAPPALVSHDFGKFRLMTYCVPTKPGKSRIIMRFVFKKSFGTKLAAALPVLHHLLANAVMDSDMYILHIQGRNLRSAEKLNQSWEQAFYMPTTSDNEITEFRRWFHGRGGNGPEDQYGQRLIDVPQAIPRRDAMDRYEHHTRNCRICQKTLKQVVFLKNATKLCSVTLGVVLLLLMGRTGLPGLMAKKAVLMAIGMVLSLVFSIKLQDAEAKFRYTDYFHWNR